MKITTIRLDDLLRTQAQNEGMPTMLVRISNAGASIRIDDELDLLPQDARDSLKAEDHAIVRFDDDVQLSAFIVHLRALSGMHQPTPLNWRVDGFRTDGRTETFCTQGW